MEIKKIKATGILPQRKNGNSTKVRVAAYCRVSTDSEEQHLSYESQVQYYQKMISEREDWILYKIFADEAISGTKTDKREEFQQMIQAGVDGKIDMIITKSISRFARNTIDTLKYVRLLKEKRVAVFFEEENINTLTMDGELLLTILSSVAQQEVHNTSEHVKKGLMMKMERGELVGFQGCLGYDYDKETKKIVINEEEAKIVRYIYKRYIEGAGTYVISRELEELGYKTKSGSSRWQDSTVNGILKNEKYKDDILLGKTLTLDPISKRRIHNKGESDQFYLQNHHDAIIPAEVYDEAMRIMAERRPSSLVGTNQFTSQRRERISRRYAFSSALQCGYCGANLTRRKKNGKKFVWQCERSTKYGRKACNNGLSVEETIIEQAFVEALNHLVDPRNTVKIEEFLRNVETALATDSPQKKIRELELSIEELERKKESVLDMRISNIIPQEECDRKYAEIKDEIKRKHTDLENYKLAKSSQIEAKKRLDSFREHIFTAKRIDMFSRDVFESSVDKVIVGGYDKDRKKDEFLLNFVFKSKPSDTDYIGKINMKNVLKIGEFDMPYTHYIFRDTEDGYKTKVILNQVHVIFSVNTEERKAGTEKIGEWDDGI